MAGLHDGATLGDLVLGALRRFPHRVAFRQDDRELTYAAVTDLLGRWATLFRQRGLQPGQGVGVLSPNRPEVYLGQTAPILAGGRFTALHPLGSLDDHLYACNEAELRFLLVDPLFAERRRPAAREVGRPRGACSPSVRPTSARTSSSWPRPSERRRPTAAPMAPTTWRGSSTPAAPPACRRRRCCPTGAVAQMAHERADRAGTSRRSIRYLACAPISHAAGMLITPTLLAGGTVVLQKSFDPAAWLAAVASERITLSLLVPTMIYAVLDHPSLASTDLASLETVMYGASPMSPTRMAEAMSSVGPVFCQLYGQTECAGIATSLWRAQHDAADLAAPHLVRDGDAGRAGASARRRRRGGTRRHAGRDLRAGRIASCRATSSSPTSRPTRSAAGGCAPATWPSATATGSSTSSTARRT